MPTRTLALPAAVSATIGALLGAPAARGDQDNTLIPNNTRLNNSVVANVYTMQHQAGCTNDVKVNPQLQQAAQRHADDLLQNRDLDGDIGSDGSTPQDRANAAGYRGTVAETVAINPALAISGVELLNRWYDDPADHAIMSDCAHTQMGVWSKNSLDRTVVVAVYGRPEKPDPPVPSPVDVAAAVQNGADLGPLRSPGDRSANVALDPSPDYDASDELEFGINWVPWILRGIYPPPAMPSQ